MKKHSIRILSIMLLILAVFSTVSCDWFGTTTSSEFHSTTAEQTTVVTTQTSSESTTVTTTVITHTTTSGITTTIDNTTSLTTTDAVTTMTTTAGTTTSVTTTFDTTTSATTYTTTSVPTTTIPTTTTSVSTTTYNDQSEIIINGPSKLVYVIGESLDLTGLNVVYYDETGSPTVLTSNQYNISDVEMNIYGEKIITVTYQAYTAFFTIQVNLPSYYMNAMNLSGVNLINALNTIVHSGFHGVSYGDARYILDETDQDPYNPANVIQVYTGDSVSGVWYCPTTNDCNWNREHVWPQSALPDEASNSAINTCSDLHNLKPADAIENSSRGNKYFDNSTTASSYEPRDEVKGDIARIMLYMIIMYDQLTLVDRTPNTDNLEMAMFSVLLQWNEMDPVDDFERHRNEVIYSYQHNRNPFIDYPEFADLIW